MSDMTGLSHEYAVTAEFAEQVNQAVLVLKKDRLGETVPRQSEGGVAEACAALREVVSAVLALVAETETNEPTGLEPMIPEDVIARLNRKYQSQMSYFVSDLGRALSALSAETALEDDAITVLDAICDAADASASASFRRLRRR